MRWPAVTIALLALTAGILGWLVVPSEECAYGYGYTPLSTSPCFAPS